MHCQTASQCQYDPPTQPASVCQSVCLSVSCSEREITANLVSSHLQTMMQTNSPKEWCMRMYSGSQVHNRHQLQGVRADASLHGALDLQAWCGPLLLRPRARLREDAPHVRLHHRPMWRCAHHHWGWRKLRGSFLPGQQQDVTW